MHRDDEIVWLTEYRTFGFVLKRRAYTSMVEYVDRETNEIVFEEIENDEIIDWGEGAIDYRQE